MFDTSSSNRARTMVRTAAARAGSGWSRNLPWDLGLHEGLSSPIEDAMKHAVIKFSMTEPSEKGRNHWCLVFTHIFLGKVET